MTETYKQRMECENCGGTGTHNFKKGETCKGYVLCCYCSCNTAKAVGLIKPEQTYRSGESLIAQMTREKGRPLNKYELMWLF